MTPTTANAMMAAVANLIGAPFNDILAERVEIYLAGPQAHPPAQGWRELLTGAVPALLNECRKLAYFTIVGALVLILYRYLVPGGAEAPRPVGR